MLSKLQSTSWLEVGNGWKGNTGCSCAAQIGALEVAMLGTGLWFAVRWHSPPSSMFTVIKRKPWQNTKEI